MRRPQMRDRPAPGWWMLPGAVVSVVLWVAVAVLVF